MGKLSGDQGGSCEEPVQEAPFLVSFAVLSRYEILPWRSHLFRSWLDWDGGAQPLPFWQEWHLTLLPWVAEEEAHLHVKGCQWNLYLCWYTLNTQEEEAKLLYGMLFSMKSFVAKLSPNDMKQGFLSYVTSAYRWLEILTIFHHWRSCHKTEEA